MILMIAVFVRQCICGCYTTYKFPRKCRKHKK